MLFMFKHFRYLFTLIIVLFMVSCSSSPEKTTTYFGGKIINPKTNYVLLFKNEVVVDSLLLDKNNTFLGEYSDFKEGVYYFEHGREHQYAYIQPNDSISIRLNTWDFDETLVFSGIGAEKNNTLISAYLGMEKDEKKFYSLYQLSPIKFKQKTTELLAEKKKLFDETRLKSHFFGYRNFAGNTYFR